MDGIADIDFLAELRRQLQAFATCLTGDLSAPVEHCGGWTLYDLADHLGRGNQWAATAVREQRGDYRGDPAPPGRAALVGWFDGTAATLLEALAADPETSAWTFAPPRTVGFWRRRRCQETLVHRWDAEHALGMHSEIDPALATDGIAEVFDTMVPRQMARGRLQLPEKPVRFATTDTGGSWALGAGDPVATIQAPAARLLLTLWGRRSITTDAEIDVDGDLEAARAAVARPLTP
jgi:uncharacterized protein (TIGR03083 family)